MRLAPVVALCALAVNLGSATALASTYVATAGGVNDAGDTAPRQVIDQPASGSLDSHGTSSARTTEGVLMTRNYFENPISCLCTPQGSATSQATLTATDVVITGPAGVVHGVLHLRLEGAMRNAGDHPWYAGLELAVFPQGSSYFGRINLYPDGHVETSGVLSGVPGGSMNVALDLPFDWATGTPQTIYMDLQTSAGGQSLGTTVNSATCDLFEDQDGDGVSGLHLANGTVAVTLPAGYSMNSTQLAITNNMWRGTGALDVEPGAPGDAGIKFSVAPNPALVHASLNFELPRAGGVKVDVFAADGREVRCLADDWSAAGTHVLRWDARDSAGRALSPGLYFVRLAFESKSQVIRVTQLVTGR